MNFKLFICSRESFLNILKWHNDVKENGNDDVTYILIGNKNDLVLEFDYIVDI